MYSTQLVTTLPWAFHVNVWVEPVKVLPVMGLVSDGFAAFATFTHKHNKVAKNNRVNRIMILAFH
jgi:hypothetical protein